MVKIPNDDDIVSQDDYADEGYGGILPLPVALEKHESLYGNRDVTSFLRVSTRAQKSLGRLDSQQLSEFQTLTAAGCRNIQFSSGIHSGRLDDPRHVEHLLRTFDTARRQKRFVNARELHRLIRSPDFKHDDSDGCRRKATTDEIAPLIQMAYGVILSTSIDPNLTAVQIHTLVTELSDNNGRPSKLNRQIVAEILRCREQLVEGPNGLRQMSYAKIAEDLEIPLRRVQSTMEIEVPNPEGGMIALGHMEFPYREFRRLERSGKLKGIID